MMLDDRNMVWSILVDPVNQTTTSIDYANNSLSNHLRCTNISPRPGFNKVEFSGIMDFSNSSVEGINTLKHIFNDVTTEDLHIDAN